MSAGRRAGGVSVVLSASGQTWRVTPERPWTIGRAAEADVRLGDPRISRHHATLEPTADGWVLVAHGANGMFVDGRRVERLAVHHQVTVSLGAERGVIMQLQAQLPSVPDAATQVADIRPAQPSRLPPADWYPDPAGSGRLRYFTGTEWTDHYATPSPGQQQPPGFAVVGQSYPAGPPGYSAPGRRQQAAPPGPGDTDVYRIRLQKHTGLLVLMLRQNYIFTGTFQECEQAYRAAQTHNLLAGWWGLLSALVFNWIALFANMSAMQALRRVVEQPSGQTPPRTPTPAGWYPDPSGVPVQRYWDGTRWTQQTHPR
jgi:Protein of unknown function (DUF2510)/Inner membrane component of T3SS, cytoplasmic domain